MKFIPLLLIAFSCQLFSQVPSYVPLNGLAAFYPFNGNTNDVSGNNNHAVSIGPSLTTDRNLNTNSAYMFNGVNQFMSANLSTTLTANWTISGWYKVEGGNNFIAYDIFGFGFNANANGVGFGGTGHDCYPMQYGTYDGGSGTGCIPNHSFLGSSTPDYDQWMHIVLTKSGNTYNFYFNNVPDGTATLLPMSIGNFVIGKRADNILFYNGKMDEIGIWNRVLTSGEIDSLYQATSVSVTEKNKNNEVLVYPNPTKNSINIKVNSSLLNKNFTITDVLGQVVKEGLVSSQQITLNLDVAADVYFLNIKGCSPIKLIVE